jgi:hypothetical protein
MSKVEINEFLMSLGVKYTKEGLELYTHITTDRL